ncbi:MAG: thioredoxin domain-containing protein [Patescibacteria group bacterium]
MRYFWHFLFSATLIVAFVVLFFVFSLGAKDKISFTDDATLDAPTVTIVDPSLGPKDAPITVVNFGDYQCQNCADLEQSLVALRSQYPEALKIVWKDMPNTSQHSEALNAAVAAQCAGEQKQFWEYHTLLMANQASLGAELYTQIAAELDLKSGPFTRCLENQATLPLVQRGFEEGLALGITATPTLFINRERYTGAMTTSELKRLLDDLISQL